MNTHEHDVVIVGAGPTGLTLANLLGGAGIRTLLVERNAGTVVEPRAVSIDDESLRTMQAIGLADAVIADVALDYGSHYFTASGTCFVKVEPTTREYGFPRRNAFTQPRLEATLRDGLARFPNVETRFSHRFLDAEDEGDGIRIGIAAPDGGRLTTRARYLVGCDGARSAIRKSIGATLTGSTYAQRWLIVDLAETRERLRQTRVVCNPSRPLITLPGPDGIRRYEFMLFDGEDETAATDETFVRDLLSRHGPDGEAAIVRRQVYAFHARIADRWRNGRIFLAGDAAHLSPPFAGQGMNSGIRDAHNLGWKLAAVVQGDIGAGLLDTYRTERAPHAWALIRLAMMMGRVMMPTGRIQAAAVQAGFRLARIAPAVQAYFAQMKYKPKPIYERGFLRASPAIAAVGRMLPQPEVEMADRRRVMLDTVLGDGFCLVAYGPEAQSAIGRAAMLDFGVGCRSLLAILPRDVNPHRTDCGAAAVVRDLGGLLAGFLPPHCTTLLLVRPDRYVAAAAPGEDEPMRRLAEDMRGLLADMTRGAEPRAPRKRTEGDVPCSVT